MNFIHLNIMTLIDIKLKRVLPLIALLIIFFISSSKGVNTVYACESEQNVLQESNRSKKAEKLIREYLTEYLYDQESYVPIRMGHLDSILIIIPVVDDEALNLAINNRDIATDFLLLYKKSSGTAASAYLDSAKTYMEYSKKWLSIAKDDMDKDNYELAGWTVIHTFKAKNAKKVAKELHMKFFLDKDLTRIIKVENIDSKKGKD